MLFDTERHNLSLQVVKKALLLDITLSMGIAPMDFVAAIVALAMKTIY